MRPLVEPIKRSTPPRTTVETESLSKMPCDLAKEAAGLGCSSGHPVAAFAAVLFQQLHIGDDHATVGGLAHGVNGEQGDAKLLILID